MFKLLKAFLRKNSLVYAIALSVFSLGIKKQALAQTVISLDLTSWETLGDVEVLNPGLANLSTDALIEDDFDLGVRLGTFNFSGNPASPVEGFGDEPFLDDFLNIDVSVLDGDTFALEGSAIKTSVTVRQDDVLSFDWNFLTNETSPQIVTQFDDYSFFLVNENLTTLATIDDTTAPGSLLSFDRETGINSFDFTFPQAGTYQIALGVVDREDFITTSALSISNVTLTSEPTSTPEPGKIPGFLMLIGLLIAPRFWKKNYKIK